jgi:hypothetical protein
MKTGKRAARGDTHRHTFGKRVNYRLRRWSRWGQDFVVTVFCRLQEDDPVN